MQNEVADAACKIFCRMAMARCVVGIAANLNMHRQNLGNPSPPGNGGNLEARDKLLQQCCILYAEHLVTSEQPLSAAAVLEILPDTARVSAHS